jgi:hypothetical protein
VEKIPLEKIALPEYDLEVFDVYCVKKIPDKIPVVQNMMSISRNFGSRKNLMLETACGWSTIVRDQLGSQTYATPSVSSLCCHLSTLRI